MYDLGVSADGETATGSVHIVDLPDSDAARVFAFDEPNSYLFAGGYREHLIACGPLLSDDASEWLGTAMLVESPDPASAQAMLMRGPYAQAGLYESVEVHNWRFGGRPQN